MSLDFALNHMTVARAPFRYLLEIAQGLGCIGVELRTDLAQPIFDGLPAAQAGAMCRDKGLRILALAEVARFNAWSAEKAKEALSLIETAKAAGAEAINLIPRSDKGGMNEGERQANLRIALRELRPMLEDHGLRGFVEPLGFKISALRFKQEAVDVIEALDATQTFSLVHDTFHHHLAHSDYAEESPIFPEHTGIVHVSGVVDQRLATNEMQDAHRTLVDDRDRAGNLDQIHALRTANYAGPISIEAFAPDLHAIEDPVPALRASMDFMRANLKAQAA